MWIVMRVQPFDLEQDPGPFPFPIEVQLDIGKKIGYLPVYETREDAEAEYPNGPFGQIAEVQ